MGWSLGRNQYVSASCGRLSDRHEVSVLGGDGHDARGSLGWLRVEHNHSHVTCNSDDRHPRIAGLPGSLSEAVTYGVLAGPKATSQAVADHGGKAVLTWMKAPGIDEVKALALVGEMGPGSVFGRPETAFAGAIYSHHWLGFPKSPSKLWIAPSSGPRTQKKQKTSSIVPIQVAAGKLDLIGHLPL